MAAVTVTRSEDRLIAIKQVPAERSAELDREAELLKRLDHPGIVRFVDLVKTSDGGRELHTLFVSSDTWATRPLTDPVERAEGVAALAAVLADLHDLGITHRHITAAHVMHSEDDRPVLCSLARVGSATPDNQQIDLMALADLVYDDAVSRGPLAGRLSSLANNMRNGQLSARELAQKLDRLLAQRARRDASLRSVGRRELVRRIPVLPIPKRLAVAAGIGMTGITAVVVAMLVIQPGRDADIPAAAGPSFLDVQARLDTSARAGTDTDIRATDVGAADVRTTDARTTNRSTNVDTTDARTTNRSTLDGDAIVRQVDAGGDHIDNAKAVTDSASRLHDHISRGGTGNAPTSAPSPDETITPPNSTVDNSTDSGSDSVTVAEVDSEATGAVLEHAGRRYAIGIQGDIVLTGDWNCDGVSTPSIVRPSTGAVVLFEEWPRPGETISRPIRWLVDVPTDAQVETHDSCDMLRVHTAVGSRLLNPRAM